MNKNLSLSDLMRSTKNKLIATSVAVSLASGLIAWQMVLKKDFEKLALIGREKKIIISKQNSLKNLAAFEDKIRSYKKMLAANRELSWVIESLNQMAQESGVTLTSIIPQENITTLGDLEKMTVGVESESDYYSLGVFVSKIESSSVFLKISGIRIVQAPSTVENSGSSLNTLITVSVFHPINTMGKIFE